MTNSRPGSPAAAGADLDAATRDLLLLVTRLAGGLKRAGSRPPEAAARDLGPRHYRALAHLVFEGEMGVGQLGRRLEITLAGASLIVAELSRAGVVERREDDADRRRTMVRIAPAHEAWVREIVESRAEPMRRFLADLSPPQREDFLLRLTVLGDEIAAAAGPSAPITDCT